MKFDLHLHSEFSWDSKVKISDYITEAEKNNFSAISITDHNSIESHSLIDKLQSKTQVLLVPGQEVSTSQGHLLVYGWTDLLQKGLSMAETVSIAKRHDSICVAAHPFDPFRGGSFSRVFSTGIDGLETLNASAWFGFPNYLAKRALEKHNASLIALGNSDSHRLEEFGTAYSESSLGSSPTVRNLLDHLRASDAKGTRIGIPRKLSRFIRRKIC